MSAITPQIKAMPGSGGRIRDLRVHRAHPPCHPPHSMASWCKEFAPCPDVRRVPRPKMPMLLQPPHPHPQWVSEAGRGTGAKSARIGEIQPPYPGDFTTITSPILWTTAMHTQRTPIWGIIQFFG
jgi:hypothetical protein